jgi:hypothetical protein
LKLHYFAQASADQDDDKLRAAIELKVVPPTCLLGGEVIQSFLFARAKPCDACNGPRKKCHGSERLEDDGEVARFAEIDRLLRGGDTVMEDFLKRGAG